MLPCPFVLFLPVSPCLSEVPVQDESSLETELEEVEQDDLIRFWWDRIMWSENGDAEEVKADFPFFACRLTTAALDTVMSGCPSNTEAAMSAGAMRPLVQLLHNAVSCRRHQVVLSTTGALASLLDGNAEAQRDFIIRRGIAPLMSLLRIPLDPSMVPFQLWLQLQAKAALCVQRLVEDFPMGQRRVRQAGALPCLLSLLEEVLSKGQQQEGSGKEQEDAALESALWAINNLTANNQDNQEALRRAMGIPALVAVLRNPGLGALTVSGAIWSVSQLALGSSVAQVELAECGVVPALMEVARRQPVGDNSLCEGVARAVGALANNCYANQELLRIEGAVSLMVEMLQVAPPAVPELFPSRQMGSAVRRGAAEETMGRV